MSRRTPSKRKQQTDPTIEISWPVENIAMRQLSPPPILPTRPERLTPPPTRPQRLTPPPTPSRPEHLSNLSSITTWGRSTLHTCMRSAAPDRFSWLQLGEPDEITIANDRKKRQAGRWSKAMSVSKWSEDPEDVEDEGVSWSAGKKWTQVVLLSWMSFLAPMCSLVLAPAVPHLSLALEIRSSVLATLLVSIYTLGFAVGPLVMAPMSEQYGRLPVFHFSNVCLTGLLLACAFSSGFKQLIIFRGLAGALGTAGVTIGSSIVLDLFEPGKMARPMSAWALGPSVAPFVGAIVGGVIVQYLHWRWIFYILAAVAGLSTLVCFMLMRETNARIVRKQQSEAYLTTTKKETSEHLFSKSVVEPLRLLWRNPIIAANSLYIGCIYGILYLVAVCLPYTYSAQYQLNYLESGLAYIPMALGIMLGLPVAGTLSGRRSRKAAPEDQISWAPLLLGSIIMAGAIALYGWTTQQSMHWTVPLVGLLLYSVGVVPMTLLVQTYLVAAFPREAKSLMSLLVITRALFTSMLPLCAPTIYAKLGFDGGNTLLAGIVLLLGVIPLTSKLVGESTRKRFKLNLWHRPQSTIHAGLRTSTIQPGFR